MVELKVILGQLNLPCRGTGPDFVRLGPVGEVLVVGPDDDRKDRPTK